MKLRSFVRGLFWSMRRKIILLAGAATAAALFYPVGVFTLTQNDGQVIFSRRAAPGDTFQLAYLHSVARSEVREHFRIDSEYRLVLTQTRFQGQGTGLPYQPGPGEELLREGDWFSLRGMNRIHSSIAWRVQPEWKSRFTFRGEPEMDFSHRDGSALIHIQAQRLPLWKWLILLLSEVSTSRSPKKG